MDPPSVQVDEEDNVYGEMKVQNLIETLSNFLLTAVLHGGELDAENTIMKMFSSIGREAYIPKFFDSFHMAILTAFKSTLDGILKEDGDLPRRWTSLNQNPDQLSENFRGLVNAAELHMQKVRISILKEQIEGVKKLIATKNEQIQERELTFKLQQLKFVENKNVLEMCQNEYSQIVDAFEKNNQSLSDISESVEDKMFDLH